MNYWKRLSNHPGAPFAVVLYKITAIFAVILSLASLALGVMREDGNWWIGLIASVLWIPVLITARAQPLPNDHQ